MYYLDEDINVTVSIDSGVITQNSIAQYALFRGSERLFLGSCFLPAGITSKTIRVNELIEDHKWKNNLKIDDNFSLTTGIVDSYKLTIYAGRNWSTNFEVANIYRYPHFGKTSGLFLLSTPDRFQMMVDGFDYTNNTYKLTPHIPYINSGEFIFPLVFESDVTSQVQPMIIDKDGHEIYTQMTSVHQGYNKGNLTLYQILGQSQIQGDGQLWLAEEGVSRHSLVAHIDLCPAPYYLVWQDRYGGTQSQPFKGTSTFLESIERSEIMTSTLNRQISGVNIQPKFIINSAYLPFEQLPYWEGLFVSPWLQLWDTSTGYSYNVIITDNEYVEASFKSNGKSMYHLQLNLEVNKKQNVIW